LSVEEAFQVAAAIIASIGGSSVIVAALSTWIGKIWANRLMQRDIARHQEDLERLKSELKRLESEHSVRFARLHERQAEVIASLYEKLYQFNIALHRLLFEYQHREIREDRVQLQEQILEQEQRRIEHEKWLAEEQRRRELERRKHEEQQDKEREAANEFGNLRSKYLAEAHKTTSPSSALYLILLKIDTDEILDNDQIDWLRPNNLWGTLAIYFQNEYKKTRDPWTLVKASGHWRDFGQPDKAITLTDSLLDKHSLVDTRAKAAILTTRGGAYRDIHNLPAAERCAHEAIRHNEASFQPYNLLGAIYFERGEAQKGEACFLRALELGAHSQAQEAQMQGALENAGQVEQKAVARYLLQRDPIKYKWAEYYLEVLK
jgi:hypothetical protein